MRCVGSLLILTLVGVLVLPAAASAAPAQPHGAVGLTACRLTVENPHYSPPPRASGIIAKARASCSGLGFGSVTMRVTGTLGVLPGTRTSGPGVGPPRPRAFSDQTQDIPINGERVTYYIPAPGSPLPQNPGWYEASADGTIVDQENIPIDPGLPGDTKVEYVDVLR